AGYKVVICDQLEAPSGKAVVRRDITRVLTPGTVVEEAYLEPSRSNHLVAAWTHGTEAGLAVCDVSTGELLLCQLPSERLAAELERLAPVELLKPPEVEAYRFDPQRGRQRLRDAESIELRLGAVAELVADPELRGRVASALQGVGDLERLCARAVQGHSGPRELVALRRSLEAIPAVAEAMSGCQALAIREAGARLNAQPELAAMLAKALVDDPVAVRDGGAIRAGYDDQ